MIGRIALPQSDVRLFVVGKYPGMGDGASFSTATEQSFRTQDLNYYNGKILRLNPDGTAPSDNPFYDGNPNSVRSKVYSYGLGIFQPRKVPPPKMPIFESP